MLNHKFYKYDENFQDQFVQEDDYIRISNHLIEGLKNCLSKHLFTEYDLETRIYGLSKDTTVLNREDILYLKDCLFLNKRISPEYEKFMSFLEQCLSEGKRVLHEDGSPSTAGLIHDFILCNELPEDIDPRKYKNMGVKVQDQFILDNYDVFKDVKMYWSNMDNVEQGFNYHGITIITPEIAEKILQAGRTFLKENKSEQAEYFVGDDWDTLTKILEKSIAEDKLIIHFGI